MENKKILVIEDDDILSKVLLESLQKAGFDVVQAFDGEDGLRLIKSEKPDLVLLDILMPKMDGITMLKNLRKEDWGKDVNVVILTILDDIEKLADAMDNGVYTYLVKNKTQVDDLVSVVREKLKVT